jgi:L-malate glycosyltransferase
MLTRSVNVLFLDTHDNSIHSVLNGHYLAKLNQSAHINIITVVHPDYKGILRELPCPVYSIQFKSKIDLAAIKTIKMLIDKHRIDIIHCHSNRPLANAIVATYGAKRTPKVICRRGIVRAVRRYDPIEWLTTLNPRYSHTIALSEAIAQDLIATSQFSASAITTIYQAFDLDWFNIDPHFDMRASLGIPKQAFVIGTVANYRPVKGLDIFMAVILKLEKHENIHWVIVGEQCAEHLAHFIQDKDVAKRVHFLGYQATPGNYVQDFDLYIQSSRSEGLSFALVEAMLLGICSIVSDIGGMPELVSHHSRGLVFEKDNVQELLSHIIYLRQHAEMRGLLAESGKQFIQETLSLEQMTTKTEELYKTLLPA